MMSAASLSKSFTVLKPQADVVQRYFAPYYPTLDHLKRRIHTTSGAQSVPIQEVLAEHCPMNGIAVRASGLEPQVYRKRFELRR
jgi:hypothetical protein